MPELPEVETTRRGLEILIGHRFERVCIHNYSLRHPIPPHLPTTITGQHIERLSRRGKYLLMQLHQGWLVWHLGMSGSMRLDAPTQPQRTHDHVVCATSAGLELRYHDPRRFGSLRFSKHNPCLSMPDLAGLGPEPLSAAFTPESLMHALRRRSASIKQSIMHNQVVVGVGNIYATEALFQAKINPNTPACRLNTHQAKQLVSAIQTTLEAAIKAGGTTLKDFVNSRNQPGYFQQSLAVYGRHGQPCLSCGTTLCSQLLGQRTSTWCPRCQT